MNQNNNINKDEYIDFSKVHQPIRKNVFGKAYIDILENTVFKISNMAKFLYVYLDGRQGKNGFIYEKQESLANKINISVRSLSAYLQELESIKAIVKIQLHKKSSGHKFLDVIIAKEFNPYTLKFEDIENLDQIKTDILKALPYCVIGKPQGKKRSKHVDNVDNVDNAKTSQNNQSPENVENTSIDVDLTPKRKICRWATKSPRCKKLHIPKRKICRWATSKNGVNWLMPRCKICRAELEKAFSFNKRKIENNASSFSNNLLWENVKVNLRSKLTEISYKTWIEEGIKDFRINSNSMTLTATNDFSKGILESKYIDLIKSACSDITNQSFYVTIIS